MCGLSRLSIAQLKVKSENDGSTAAPTPPFRFPIPNPLASTRPQRIRKTHAPLSSRLCRLVLWKPPGPAMSMGVSVPKRTRPSAKNSSACFVFGIWGSSCHVKKYMRQSHPSPVRRRRSNPSPLTLLPSSHPSHSLTCLADVERREPEGGRVAVELPQVLSGRFY